MDFGHHHKSPLRSMLFSGTLAVLFVAIAIGMYRFLTTPNSSTTPVNAAVNNSTTALTQELIRGTNGQANLLPQTTSGKPESVESVAKKRKAAMVGALKQNRKKEFFLNILTADQLKKIPQDIKNQKLVEQPVQASGIVDAIIYDDFKGSGKATMTKHFLRTPNGPKKRKEVVFEKDITIPSGTNIAVNAFDLDGTLAVTTNQEVRVISEAVQPTTGQQKLAVLVMSLTKDPLTPVSGPETNTADIYKMFFSDPKSVTNYFYEASYGKLYMTGHVFGWYHLPELDTTYCGMDSPDDKYNDWMDKADALAVQEVGQAAFDQYTRRIYVMNASFCPFGGISSIGGTPSRSFISNYQGWPRIGYYAHEFGHALGLGHANAIACEYGACEEKGYADDGDVMGNVQNVGYSAVHMNVPHKISLGWLDANKINNITVSAGNTYPIIPLSLNGPAVAAITLQQPNGGLKYYIEYRQPNGFDSTQTAYTLGGARITTWNGAFPNSITELVDTTPNTPNVFSDAALTDGATYTDSTGISIKQTMHTAAAAYLQITIQDFYAKSGIEPWTTTTSMPTIRPKVFTTALNKYIYIMGGGTNTVSKAALNTNGTVGAWSDTTPLPINLNSAAVVNDGSNIYLIGGYISGSSAYSTGVYSAKQNADGTVGPWKTLSALPTIQTLPNAALANGYIIAVVAGANTPGGVISAKLNGDGTIGAWKNVTPMPSYMQAGGGAFSIGNTVYFLVSGGVGFYRGTVNSDGNISSWGGDYFSQNYAPNGVGYTSLGAQAVLVGGSVNGSYASVITSTAPISNIVSTPNLAYPLPKAISGAAVTSYNGYVYAIGGLNEKQGFETAVYMAKSKLPNITPTIAPTSAPVPTTAPTGTSVNPTPKPTLVPTPAITANVILTPTADAYVSADTPTVNYGTNSTIEADGAPVNIIYMKFDLKSVSTSKSVKSAKLRFFVTSGSKYTENVKSVSSTSWKETSITYSNKPSVGSTITTIPVFTSNNQYLTIDLTSFIQANRGKVVSLAIDTTKDDGLHIKSRDSDTTFYRPTLFIQN